jgi:hypothetical protein
MYRSVWPRGGEFGTAEQRGAERVLPDCVSVLNSASGSPYYSFQWRRSQTPSASTLAAYADSPVVRAERHSSQLARVSSREAC